MKSPYELLGVSGQSTDADIKLAYLQQAKEHPPERDPAGFQLIQQAYDRIKDLDSRLRHELFDLPAMEFNELLDTAFQAIAASPPLSADAFQKLLQAAPVEKVLLSGGNQL
ncbi:MAG: J domain-containing protein [Methylomonas sp.]